MNYFKMNKKEFYKDEKGYTRQNTHSNAWHRKVAYHKIYLKNRSKYKLPFSKYEVHHKDGNKSNNDPSNLQLLTPEQHIDMHLEMEKQRNKEINKILKAKKEKSGVTVTLGIVIFLFAIGYIISMFTGNIWGTAKYFYIAAASILGIKVLQIIIEDFTK